MKYNFCHFFICLIFYFSDKGLSELISNVHETENIHRNNSLMVIPSVSYTDSGYYECIASNGIPSPIKSNFSITIRGKYEKSTFFIALMLPNIRKYFNTVLYQCLIIKIYSLAYCSVTNTIL